MTTVVTQETFAETVLGNELPVLVDFWADWCHPCHMVAPVLEQIAAERAGRLVVAKVDVMDQPELAERYGITSLPTLKLFRGGEEIGEFVGAAPKLMLLADVDERLAMEA